MLGTTVCRPPVVGRTQIVVHNSPMHIGQAAFHT
jgi:hypothetical protein